MKKLSYNLIVVVIFAVIYSLYMWKFDDYWLLVEKDKENRNLLVDGVYTSVSIHSTMGFGGFPKKVIGQVLIILHLLLMFFGNLYLFSNF